MADVFMNFIVIALLTVWVFPAIGSPEDGEMCHNGFQQEQTPINQHHKQVIQIAEDADGIYINQQDDPWTFGMSPKRRYDYYFLRSKNEQPWETIENEIIEDSTRDMSSKNRYRREYKRYLAVMHLEYPKEKRIKYANIIISTGHSELGKAIILWQNDQEEPPQYKTATQ